MPHPPAQSFALVAVPVPLGRAFSYGVPANWTIPPRVGQRVLCEFGRKKLLGVVLEVTPEPPKEIPLDRVKPLLAILDEEPALAPELLAFLRELAAYYLAPVGEVLRLALPTLERAELERASKEARADAALTTVGKLVQFATRIPGTTATKLKPKDTELLEALEARGPTAIATLEKELLGARGRVQRLEKLGLLRVDRQPEARDPFFSESVPRDVPHTLNVNQTHAARAILAALTAHTPTSFLLQGVTGSGKTEIYLQAAKTCLERGTGVIVLVPEIALTPQLVARFRARLGDQIAVLHSGLSERDRAMMWQRLRKGELRVAVGARSALFAPVKGLGLICVDEEHDPSFKQEEGVRYHARDMALLRAHRARAVCVLGSATPSLTSEELVQRERLVRLVLPDRAHAQASLPTIEVVDLRRYGPGPSGSKLLTVPLHRALEEHLGRKEQAILFLNRRGFAPSIVCDACGEVLRCPNCSVALTAHRSGRERLCCHYCDYVVFDAPRCAECGSREVSLEGTGTERIESLLQQGFPEARIARLDRDVARGTASEAILDRMRTGSVDILIGTQMVAKGHDFPNVTLVGVLNADAALSMPDYQASERTFQLLVQVAGRAGRADKRGRVLIQTRNPEHAAVRCALTHDHSAFVKAELQERKEARYPPFSRLLLVRVDALDDRVAKDCIERLARVAQEHRPRNVDLLGPSAAPLERLRNRYRYRFMLRATERRPLYELAHRLAAYKTDRRARVQLDVDPVNML